MKIAFITNVPNSIGRTKLKEEAERRGFVMDILSWQNTEINKDFLNGLIFQLKNYDVVHFAGSFGEFVTQYLQTELLGHNIFCPNSYTKRSLSVDDKIFQSLKFLLNDISIPKSIRTIYKDYSYLSDNLGKTFVAKKPKSTQGKGVALITTSEELESFSSEKEEILFQEFIDYIADYRIHVVGGVSFCPYQRIAPANDFRANVSLGGSLKKIDDISIIDRISSLAIKAANALGLDYCGVDILEDKDGNLYVLETNSDPGFKEVQDITGDSFAEYIIDYYEKNIIQ